jgi:hypothetical protein
MPGSRTGNVQGLRSKAVIPPGSYILAESSLELVHMSQRGSGLLRYRDAKALVFDVASCALHKEATCNFCSSVSKVQRKVVWRTNSLRLGPKKSFSPVGPRSSPTGTV